MGFSSHGEWLAALLCVLCMGGQVQCDCTRNRIGIEGGEYKLTRDLEVGSKLIYSCNEGYYPYPENTRVCQPDGSWEPAPKRFLPQKCMRVECPDPSVLELGTVYPPQEKYFVGNETTYECYSGLTLRGSPTRVCLLNGKWSGSTPICSDDTDTCADPGIPAGASRHGRSFRFDDKVTYSCPSGLFLVGSKERVCQENGEWTGREPACYFKYTYDTTLEVSQAFGGAIRESLTVLTSLNDTKEARRIRISKNGTLNIYIAVDVSLSIDKKQIEEAKSAILTLISKISSFSVTPNYEIVFFSSEILEVVSILEMISNRFDSAQIKPAIENFNIDGRNTGTDLNLVFQTFLERMGIIEVQVGHKTFEEHRHVFIIFTDGEYNMGGSPAPTVEKIKNKVYLNPSSEAEVKAREEYLDIYIFGVGENVLDEDLEPLALGTGGPHYFRMQKIENLNKTFDDMIDEEQVRGLCGLHKDYGTYKRNLYPWMAFIIVQNEGGTQKCMGSLVSPEFVLTAAHCFPFGVLPEHITVELDDGQGRVKKVEKFFSHPKYNIRAKVDKNVAEFYDYDVALIQLKTTIKISPDARPICIPCTKETNDALHLAENANCKQQEQLLLKSHYENLNFLTRTSNLVDFKNVYAKLGDNRDGCIRHALSAEGIKTDNISEVVTDRFLCTGGVTPFRQHIACTGDSGGAVYKDHKLRTIQIGVVSWGTRKLCEGGGLVESNTDSRDFHINLFRVVPFLKSILGNDDQDDYAPLEFLPGLPD